MTRKINFREILPKKDIIKMIYGRYISDHINIKMFDGKLYEDHTYSKPTSYSNIDFMRIYGDWQIDTHVDDEGCVVKFIDNKSGQYFELVFPSISDQIVFLKEMYCNRPIKQIGSGYNVEALINKETPKTKYVILTTLLTGIFGYLLFRKSKL